MIQYPPAREVPVQLVVELSFIPFFFFFSHFSPSLLLLYSLYAALGGFRSLLSLPISPTLPFLLSIHAIDAVFSLFIFRALPYISTLPPNMMMLVLHPSRPNPSLPSSYSTSRNNAKLQGIK
ncbi:hypothetical protein F5148DRAFT_86413 [Russula earlei]|uniref:Uncharacterized protein n=1 Tax=Russula earlei TaxID=71964 RepID=A0ACC0U7G9_9AGAM|nr:hypothetical protein F5148DRAFT_86413 [Russula earlei]